MDILGHIALSVLLGGVVGFANGAGTRGLRRPIRTAVLVGTLFGVFLAAVSLFGHTGLLNAGCLFLSSVAGSLIAAITPDENPLKRYFDLNYRRRYKVKVTKGVRYSSKGGALVEIDAEDGSLVDAYENAVVNAATGSTIFKYRGAVVNAQLGAKVIDC